MKNKDGSDLSLRSYIPALKALPFLVLALVAVASFGNTLKGFFLCDDLLHLGYLWQAFNIDSGLLLAPFYSPWLKDTSFYVFYRPLTELSFALDYLVYGSHAFGYHLTSLIWHMVNVWLLFVLIKTLTTIPVFYIAGKRERTCVAFFCAAIWAAYPTHSEAIGWIAARSDLMATAFYFSTLILFARMSAAASNISVALVALPLVLGFLTKELTISLPCVLYALSFFSFRHQRLTWWASARAALLQTLPYLIITAIYIVGRGLALGDFIGGYSGSMGQSLNKSLANRWLFSESFFKVFHPFNDQIIAKNSALRLMLRLLWGLCAVITIVVVRLGGALAAKYRLMLFALVWLLLTLAPNLQVWSFTTTMAGGRIAYLPMAPIVLLIVLSVYPLGANALSGKMALALKLVSLSILTGLTILSMLASNLNNLAWLEASNMVRTVRGQIGDLTDSLANGQRLVLLNLPTNVKGAFAFTSPGMVETLLKPPLATGDDSDKIVVLDAQPCSYPYVNFADVQSTANHSDAFEKFFQLYYFDQDLGRLMKSGQPSIENANQGAEKETIICAPTAASRVLPPVCSADIHDNEEGGENFRFKIAPAINPTSFEFARLRLTLNPQAKVSRSADQVCYVWHNCPADDDGLKQQFSVKLIDLPKPGETATYLIRLGENKLWLLSHDVDVMQIFIPFLKDGAAALKLDFLPADTICPKLTGAVSGESESDSLLSLKHLSSDQQLTLFYDAGKIAGAKKVKIELLPPYSYFDHYIRKLPRPSLLPQHLRLIESDNPTGPLTGKLTFKVADFPRSAIYQFRACAVDEQGAILGDFSEPITVTVTVKTMTAKNASRF